MGTSSGFAIVLLSLLLSACISAPGPEARREAAQTSALARDWQKQSLPTSRFNLQAFVPKRFIESNRLTIYIEGDGFAWVNGHQPSTDPTPINPVALNMALAQPAGNAAYLARPCQYLREGQPLCNVRYWTDARFAEEVVASMDQAVDTLKSQANAKELVLVGYSGGGAVALLLAGRRQDVSAVVTVAGNVDPEAWTRFHKITPLSGSLNPANLGSALATVQQIHLSGDKDRIVPTELTQRFVSEHPARPVAQVWVMPGYDHGCCWAQNWPSLWMRVVGQLHQN